MNGALAVVEPRASDVRSSSTAPKILIADDDRDMCELAEAGLSQRGYGVSWRLSPDEALAHLDNEDFAILLVDIHMEGMSGLDLCRAALAKRPDLVVVVMTGFGTLEHAIGAMRAGAYDFITKPVSMDALALTIDRALRHRAMTDELRRLRRRVDEHELPNVIGDSEAMQRMADIVSRVETALKYIDKERITLNPDCGFAPGSAANVDIDEVYLKLKNEAEAARILRQKHE